MKKTTIVVTLAALLAGMQTAPAVSAKSADEIDVAVAYDISTMDVTETTDNYLVPMNVFDRLFETRPGDGQSEIVGSLCTDYSVSEDGLTYDFEIRDDVVFSNGSALTASDILYTFERLLSVNKDNTDIPLEVAGSEDFRDGKADSLEGIKVKDDTHFSITLNSPNAGFTAELSAPAMSIVDAESMPDLKGFGEEPADTIGSGPYIVTEWVANDHYTLEYNDKYWGEEPSVKKVTVNVIPDMSSQNLMFQNGELDIIDLRGMDSAIIQSTYKTMYADQMVSTPNVGLTFMALNENNTYLKDVNVRKAVAMAIDVDAIITSIYFGDATRENGVIPSGVWAHNDSQKALSYDPEAAKALLKESGYNPGDVKFELSLSSSADGNIKLVYQTVSQMLKKAGITATIKSYEQSAWIDLRMSGEMDAYIGRWGMDYNDPANIMYTFFGNENNTAQRSLNYPDKEILDRVAAASAIVDDAEREKEYQALDEKITIEDAAIVPLYASLHLYCLGERVESFTPHWAGFTDFYVSDVVLK